MIQRSDIIWLGVSAAVMGAMVAGLMLGIGLALAASGAYVGFLLIIPGVPVAGMIGWLLSRRLARRVGS
jgi:hypothetical protein